MSSRFFLNESRKKGMPKSAERMSKSDIYVALSSHCFAVSNHHTATTSSQCCIQFHVWAVRELIFISTRICHTFTSLFWRDVLVWKIYLSPISNEFRFHSYTRYSRYNPILRSKEVLNNETLFSNTMFQGSIVLGSDWLDYSVSSVYITTIRLKMTSQLPKLE